MYGLITDNPVSELTLYRSYAVFCLPHVLVLDGAPVTASERQRSQRMFAAAQQARGSAEAEWRESGMPQVSRATSLIRTGCRR